MPSVEYRFEYDRDGREDGKPSPVKVVRVTAPMAEWVTNARKVERRVVRAERASKPTGLFLANFVRPCESCGGADNGYRRLCDPCKATLYPK